MKESVKVNINGQLFNLDNDAYNHLQKYLDSIERKFKTSPNEAKEILEDIEARIAELLSVSYSDPLNQVVSIGDIIEITKKLGSAEEIDSQEQKNSEPESSSTSQSFFKKKKRLYRNTDQSVLGGVGSGIALYLNIDPIWIRLLFIFLVFAKLFGLIIYIVLWAIIPAAKTIAQKHEMRGEDDTIDNIKKSVSKEYEKVKDGVKNIPNTNGYKNIEGALSEFFKTVGNILLIIVKVIGAIIAVSLFIALIILVLNTVSGGSFDFHGNFFHQWYWHWNIFDHWPNFTWFGVCLFLVIVLPIIAVFGKLVRWLFNIQTKNSIAAGVGATIWVVALISLIAIYATDSSRNVFRRTFATEHKIQEGLSKILYIDVNKFEDSKDFEYYHVFGYDFIWNDNQNCFYRNPDVKIIHTSDEDVKIEILRNFICFKSEVSETFESRIVDFEYSLSGNRLLLDEYYSSPEYASWRLPKLKIKLYIPEGTRLIYSKEVPEILEGLAKQNINNGAKEEKMIKMKGRTDF
jgi:phage shock protein PspC (stress-responsive transcriptional regulator)/DNA-directed RNA polymerase subunit H (RpoH/RPB5)